MAFYDLTRFEREKLVAKMKNVIKHELENGKIKQLLKYATDADTYIRKNAYQSLGKLYFEMPKQQKNILDVLKDMLTDPNEKVRQTEVYALGEIGKKDADKILVILEASLEDEHHSVRNAVTGSLKQMGEKNPKPTLDFAKKFLHHPDPEIRRQVVHGIELRGRTHPEDVLPLLAEVQDEKHKRVKPIIVHVITQISYKKGCLEKVIPELKTWENKLLVDEAFDAILKMYKEYDGKFANSYEDAKKFIET